MVEGEIGRCQAPIVGGGVGGGKGLGEGLVLRWAGPGGWPEVGRHHGSRSEPSARISADQ